jgi:predicted ribosomally synthesized peptide with SipW-like signal peptide
MKKILFGIMAIVLCIGLMGAAFASFSDTAQSTGNRFAAGTLDLQVDNNPVGGDAVTWVDSGVINIQSMTDAVNNLKPGFSMSNNIDIRNIGTLPGTPTFKLTITADDENGASALELAAGDTTGPVGELSKNVYLVLRYGDTLASSTLVGNGYLSDFNTLTLPAPVGSLLANGVGSWFYTVSIDSAVGNIIQSDICTFNIDFGLVQVP